MTLVRQDRLETFHARHRDAAAPLKAWAAVVRQAQWRNLKDLRETYAHADPVRLPDGRTVHVFNIKGNRYRLVASLDYGLGAVNVLLVMTHAEYSKGRWKGQI